jgi:hypothetical protein
MALTEFPVVAKGAEEAPSKYPANIYDQPRALPTEGLVRDPWGNRHRIRRKNWPVIILRGTLHWRRVTSRPSSLP